MSVIDGQDANAATFNGAFASKQADNIYTGKQSLQRPASGAFVTDVQQAINDGIAETATKIPLAQKDAANGVASLDGDILVPLAEIPPIPASRVFDFNFAAQTVIDADKGVPGGITPLGLDSKVPALYLPSFVDDVLEYADLASFPVTGETGKIYVALDTAIIYRWSGSIYVPISPSPGSTDEVPEGAVNKYFTEARVRSTVLTGLSLLTGGVITAADSVLVAFGKLQKQISDHLADMANPHGVTKAQVGLANVDNTSDVNKPVSTAQQIAIDAKVADAINDGVTTIAPSQNAVFDALAGKANSADSIVNALIFG